MTVKEKIQDSNHVLTLDELKPGMPCRIEFKVNGNWTCYDPSTSTTMCFCVNENYVIFCDTEWDKFYFYNDPKNVESFYGLKTSKYMTHWRCLKAASR